MDDFENSVAALDKEIKHRNLIVKDLEISVWKNKLEISNREKQVLMENLENKDNQLLDLRDKLRKALKTLNENQAQLKESITAQHGLENVICSCNLKVNSNEDLLDSKEIRIRDRNEVLKIKVNTQDKLLSELRSMLHQKEAMLDKINISRQHLENEIERRDKLLKEKDEQLSDQIEKVEQTSKTLRKTEVKSEDIINSLKKSNRLLEADLDKSNLEINHLKNLLQCKKTEMKDINELLGNAVKEKDNQVYLRKQALKEKADKVFESNQIISSLQIKMQNLEKVMLQIKRRNECIEKNINEKDVQLLQKESLLNQTLKALHETETDSGYITNVQQCKIQSLERETKNLKDELDRIKIEMNGRHEILVKNLQEKEKQLSELKDHRQQELNQVYDKEAKFKTTIISLHLIINQLEEGKKEHDLKVKGLEKMLDTANMKIRDTTKLPVNNLLKERECDLSDLTDQLQNTLKQMQETEIEFDGVITSQRKQIQHLEKQIQQLEKEAEQRFQTIKKQDEMLVSYKDKMSEQNDQLNHTLKRLREADTESSRIITLLKSKHSGLEAGIERRDVKIKDLCEQLDRMRTENSSGNEFHAKRIEEMEKQLLEQKNRLQQVVSRSQEKETKLGRMISSLKEQNLFLEKQVHCCDLKVKRLERLLDNKDTAIGHTSKVAEEKDDQISELRDYMLHSLTQMHSKESDTKEFDISHMNKQEYLGSEVENIKRNNRHLEEEKNSKKAEMGRMSTEMELVGRNKMKDDQLRDKGDQIKKIQEKETELAGSISALKMKCQDLETDIKHRDMTTKDFEETLDSMKTAVSEGNELLERKVKEHEKQLSDQRDQLQKALNESCNKEFQLNNIITSLKNQNQEKDQQVSKLKNQLEQALKKSDLRKVEIEDIDISLKSKIKFLEAEIKRHQQNVENLEEMSNSKQAEMTQMSKRNELLETKLKDKDEQNGQLNSTLKTLQENEKELGGIITSLKNENQVLKKNIERRDQKVEDLEKKTDSVMTEFSGKYENFEMQLSDKEKRLSEQRNQLHQASNQLKEKETEIDNLTTLQKKENKEKDNQISDLKAQLQKTTKDLEGKKAEVRDIDISMKKQKKRLESEVEQRDLNVSRVEEMLSSTKVDMRQLLERNEKLESVSLGKDNKLHEQRDQLTLTKKKLQETDNELGGIITSLKKKVWDLQIDIEHRNVQIHDLTEKLDDAETDKTGKIDLLTKKTNQLSEKNCQLQQALNQVYKKEAKLNDINTSLQKQNQEKDNHVSELKYQKEQILKQLNDKEAELEELVTSLKNKLKSLETEAERHTRNIIHLEEELRSKEVEIARLIGINKLLENRMKEKDDQLREQNDQIRQEIQQNDRLNSTLKIQQENEKELGGIITSLKNENQVFEKKIECRDKKVEDLEKKIDSMMTEISGKYEHFAKQLNDKEKQLSEQRNQLHQAFSQLKEKETEINNFTILQKKHNKEKDDQISDLRAQLQQASIDIEGKQAEVRDIDISMKKQRKRLESEVEHRVLNISRLEEILSSKKVEIARMIDINKRLENKMKEKDDQFRGQSDQLRQEIQHLQREVERRDLKVADLDKMLHCQKIETGEKEENKELREKDQKIADLKDQLQKTSVKLHDTETELDETKTRLSKAMGDRLTDNNPNITDLSDRNRPTKLAEKCAELYDNQWTDAFDILDKHFDTEISVIEALLRILQDVMTFCIKKAHEQMEELGRELKFAEQHGSGDVTADVRKLFKDCRKAVASVAVGNLYKMYESHLKRSTDKTLRTALEVSSYTSECLEISWFMVIQDPPVAFAPLLRKGSSFNTDLYKPYTSSGTHIDYVVWPPLLLHEGGPILAKGVAQGYGKKQKESKQ